MTTGNPAKHMSKASESVRAFNHVSRASGKGWEYPSHSYTVLGSLSYMAGILAQAIDQATFPVTWTMNAGRVLIDGGGDAHKVYAELMAAQADAMAAAEALSLAVQRMHNATSPMGLDTRGLPEFEDDDEEELSALPMHDSHNPEYGFGR